MSNTALVVDDSASLRSVLRITLEQAGYSVIEACDGEQALKLLDGRPLACVVCDVAMPRMDGPTFLRAMRAIGAYRRTPVVVVTTQTSITVREECRRAGAGAWIAKPFQPKMLVDTLVRLGATVGATA